jgi:hypothetical protein
MQVKNSLGTYVAIPGSLHLDASAEVFTSHPKILETLSTITNPMSANRPWCELIKANLPEGTSLESALQLVALGYQGGIFNEQNRSKKIRALATKLQGSQVREK